MVNNRQKISANIITERMVKEESFEGNPILVVSVPRADGVLSRYLSDKIQKPVHIVVTMRVIIIVHWMRFP